MSEVIDQVQGDVPELTDAPPATSSAEGVNPRDAFIAMLPEELRGEGVFANHQSVGDLAKSYVSAAKMVGLDKGTLMSIPRGDDDKAWGEVYSKLGRPESADKYALDAYKDKVPEAALKEWANVFHELGFNQKQLDTTLGKFFGQAEAGREAQKAELDAKFQEWDAAVTKDLGLAKDRKLTAAINTLENAAGTDEILAHIEAYPEAFRHPLMVKALVNLADKTGESSVLLADGRTTNGALSPADAQQQLAALKSNPEYMKAMRDNAHPQHDYFVAQQNKLFEFAYPG
jgi:hypothetical protein